MLLLAAYLRTLLLALTIPGRLAAENRRPSRRSPPWKGARRAARWTRAGNAALRAQLDVYRRQGQRAKLQPCDRLLWILLLRLWPGWRSALVVVRPETVERWSREGLGAHAWGRRGRPGRPRIPKVEQELIRRISRESPTWGEDRIALELRAKLGVRRAASTVRRYMVRPRPSGRSRGASWGWGRFLRAHVLELERLVADTVSLTVEAWVRTGRRCQRSAASSTRMVQIEVVDADTKEVVRGGVGESLLLGDLGASNGPFASWSGEVGERLGNVNYFSTSATTRIRHGVGARRPIRRARSGPPDRPPTEGLGSCHRQAPWQPTTTRIRHAQIPARSPEPLPEAPVAHRPRKRIRPARGAGQGCALARTAERRPVLLGLPSKSCRP